jgi:predicted DNA-binding ribbon-helix-helix protein
MSSDPNKKSPRTFQCRDVLWDTFEQMARELECSVDYLINESMKQYARQRNYGECARRRCASNAPAAISRGTSERTAPAAHAGPGVAP